VWEARPRGGTAPENAIRRDGEAMTLTIAGHDRSDYWVTVVYTMTYQGGLSKGRSCSSHREADRGNVCGGLAEWIGWDPTVVRVLYVGVSILSVAFRGILVYVMLWVVMPKAPE
jgi:phage shock protein C